MKGFQALFAEDLGYRHGTSRETIVTKLVASLAIHSVYFLQALFNHSLSLGEAVVLGPFVTPPKFSLPARTRFGYQFVHD
jgi:hypothetical protein